jgi:hypothetical protein
MNYFKPGHGKFVRAKGKILHWGRKTVAGECVILDESGKLLESFILLEKEFERDEFFTCGKLHTFKL